MVDKPRIEIAFPEVMRNEPSGRVLIRTLAPEAGKKQPTANFTVRIVDPATGLKIRGVPVFVSYYIDGAEAQPQNIHGSPGTTNEDGCATFECPTHQSLVRRIVIKIECNGSSLECHLLPPLAAAVPPPIADETGGGVVAGQVADLVSGSIVLDDEPPAAMIVPPAIPPPPDMSPVEPLTVDDLMLVEEPGQEPIPISRRTEIGVPVFAAPPGTNPQEEEDGVVSSPMPESHIGDTVPHEFEAPTRAAPRPAEVFAESVHELEKGGAEAKGEAPSALNPLAEALLRLEEALAQARELRLQFASSIRDEVELQRQLRTAYEALFKILAKADATFITHQANIDEELREIRETEKTFGQLLETVDLKALSLIETMSFLGPEFDKDARQLFAQLKTELEQARDEAVAAIQRTSERERRSMVDLSREQKEQIRRTAPDPPIVMLPVIPFRLDTTSRPSRWRETGRRVLLAAVVTIGAGSIAALIIDFVAHL